MNQNDIKPLQPLPFGNVLIVGGKASNFDDELRNHPRVIMWDSQHEHWTDKDLPQNVRAVFITRWIGHAAFGKILGEARKRQITIFNPEGTGMIVKQVRELLDITRKVETKMETTPTEERPKAPMGSLKQLVPFIDWNKTNIANAQFLLGKVKDFGITSTLASLSNFVGVQRKKLGLAPRIPIRKVKPLTPEVPRRVHKYVDVSVEILDNMVKELQDMRDYLVAVTDENKVLKARIDKFKKALGDD